MTSARPAPLTADRSQYWLLAALILLCLAVGAAGSVATTDAVRNWYPTLEQPSWTPPNWLFGPVWTTLYVLIGISGWLVRPAADSVRTGAWRVWWLQLALNAVWSPVFFGAHRIAAAAVIIVALWITIGTFVFATWRHRRAAALLFLPYWLWVSYASALNLAIWQLNR